MSVEDTWLREQGKSDPNNATSLVQDLQIAPISMHVEERTCGEYT